MLRVELHKLGDVPPSPVGTRRKLSNKPPSRDTPPVSLLEVAALPEPEDAFDRDGRICTKDALSTRILPVPPVDVNHYARYGKTRAEEDARRYLQQKEELEEQKKELRSALISLRRDKREVKEEMKNRTG